MFVWYVSAVLNITFMISMIELNDNCLDKLLITKLSSRFLREIYHSNISIKITVRGVFILQNNNDKV